MTFNDALDAHDKLAEIERARTRARVKAEHERLHGEGIQAIRGAPSRRGRR